MGDVNHEPTMEEILASIKKIIAEDGDGRAAPRHYAPAQAARPADDVLELTEPVRHDPPPEAQAAEDLVEEALLSAEAEGSSRAALAMLSSLARAQGQVNEAAGSQALEDLVREMLKPMLKQWLDDNLPALVESLVAREIARIADRG